jgi:hypothetical protein
MDLDVCALGKHKKKLEKQCYRPAGVRIYPQDKLSFLQICFVISDYLVPLKRSLAP